jgi:hypothetical protein
MRILFLFLALTVSATVFANGTANESFNGHLIREPSLNDYHQGERSPGFSPITDVIDSDGRPAS